MSKAEAILEAVRTDAPAHDTVGIRFLLGSLALQNLGRRKACTFLLLAAVAICSAASRFSRRVSRSRWRPSWGS